MAVSASNPITSAVPSSSPITSVSPSSYAPQPLYATNQQLLSRLNLDLRGRVFPVDRETLMLLPESVLLGLFPQGLILSKPASWEGGDDGVFTVDVSEEFNLPALRLIMLFAFLSSWLSYVLYWLPIHHYSYLGHLISVALLPTHSLTQTASNTSSTFGPPLKRISTDPQPPPIYSTPKHPSPPHQATQQQINLPTLCSRNRPSSC